MERADEISPPLHLPKEVPPSLCLSRLELYYTASELCTEDKGEDFPILAVNDA